MKIRTAIAALLLFAAGATLAAPQAKAPGDPKMIDAQGFQKIVQEHRGKALLVNFWATWCEPCRDEYPMLNELAKQYAPKGLQVVGVSMDDDGDLILMRRFLARYKPIFPNYRKTAGAEAAFRESVLPGWTGTMPVSIFMRKTDDKSAISWGKAGRNTKRQFENWSRAEPAHHRRTSSSSRQTKRIAGSWIARYEGNRIIFWTQYVFNDNAVRHVALIDPWVMTNPVCPAALKMWRDWMWFSLRMGTRTTWVTFLRCEEAQTKNSGDLRNMPLDRGKRVRE